MLSKLSRSRIISGLCHGITFGSYIFIFIILFMFLIPNSKIIESAGMFCYFIIILYYGIISIDLNIFLPDKFREMIEKTKMNTSVILIVVTYSGFILREQGNIRYFIGLINILILAALFFLFKRNIKKIEKTFKILLYIYCFVVIILSGYYFMAGINKTESFNVIFALLICGFIFYVISFIFNKIFKIETGLLLKRFFFLQGSIFHYLAFVIYFVKTSI